jgi:predicted RND superfamily exporter protein
MGTKRTLMSNSNNVADWLPNYFVETQQYQWFLKNFPFERFVVVSWQGCTMDDFRLEMFAQKLVPGQTIDNVGQWADEHLKAELVLESDKTTEKTSEKTPAELQTESTSTNTNSTVEPVESATESTESENRPEYLNYFKSVITGPRLFRILKDRYSGTGIGGIRLTDEKIREKLKGTLIGPDGQCSALIVTLTKEAPQGKDLAKVLEAIREVGRECGVQAPKEIDTRPIYLKIVGGVVSTVKEIIYGRHPDMTGVIIGGPPVDNVAITHEGEHTLRRLAGICGLIGLFLAWLCFRDFRLTFFVFWIAIISAGVALASVSLTRGTCDAILLSMPALVYVLAMSGAIHLINYYHDAIREHGLDMAPERAVSHAWTPCFFANFTTALGLLSLYTSHLVPITKFGVYSALGVLLQLILLFYYLPTLLHFYPSHKIASERTLFVKENSTMQKIWRVWGGFIIRNNLIISLLCAATMIFFCYGMYHIKTSVKMMRFFSADSEIIHHYTWLEEQLGPLVPMEIVIKFNNEKCKFNTLDRLRLIEDIDDELRTKLAEDIGGVISAETMMPMIPRFEGTRKSAKQIAIERTANIMLEKGRSEMKDYVTVECDRSLLADDPRLPQTLSELGMTPDDAARLVRVGIVDLKTLINHAVENEVTGISKEEMQTFHEKAMQWEKNYGYDLWRISIRVWSLKKDIDYAMFIQDVKNVVDPTIEKMIARYFPQQEVADESVKPAEHADLGFTNKPIEAVYTGMVPVVYKTQHELLTGLRDSFISSFIMIAITMGFILRNPIAGLCAMIPNLFPVIVVFGFMGQFGILVDVGTMMTASVALGISVDDTIHFLTWFRDGIDQGMSQQNATRYAYSRCATSMFQTTMIAGLGLSAFALSTFTPTQMFGIMMLAILTVAMFGDLVFLAAILNTPLGYVFRPRNKKRITPESGNNISGNNISDDTISSDTISAETEQYYSEFRIDAPQPLPQPKQTKDSFSILSGE